tara:strand:- start:5888 stop:6469 length:582 start_codon:yes stop_codon:yes gene_type:complete
MLMASRGRQLTRTLGVAINEIEANSLESTFQDLENKATEELLALGDAIGELICTRSVDLRYRGQSYTLNVIWKGPADSVAAFKALHERRYGYALDGDVELVNICVDSKEVSEPLQLPSETKASTQPEHQLEQNLISEGVEISAFPREAMTLGRQLHGPCVITEYSATVYVAQNWLAEIDDFGNLRLLRTQSQK